MFCLYRFITHFSAINTPNNSAMLGVAIAVFYIGLSSATFDPTSHVNWKLLDHEECGNSAAPRIIGGRSAALGEQPWLARIGYISQGTTNITYRCGGAIINKRTILTAAHCVYNLPKNVFVGVVQVGEHNTETDPDCEEGVCADHPQVIKPSEIISHSQYNIIPFRNDIALIRLRHDIKYNLYVVPICMISGPFMTQIYEGDHTKVAGWGIYDIEDPKNSVTLQTVQMKVAKQEDCKIKYERLAPIGPTQICVGGDVGKDSCGGDSGGPLMMDFATDKQPRTYQIGIVSFGSKKCGSSTMPGIYTRMSSFIEWVLDNLAKSTTHFVNDPVP